MKVPIFDRTLRTSDPNIPETGAQVTHSVHGPPDCCHMPCQGATCPPPPTLAACQGTAHHPPAPSLETCDAPSTQSPLAPSGNPCVLATPTSRSSRSQPPLTILVVLLQVTTMRHAAQRTMFLTRK
ncbi:hypothetical protein LSTR_LSTR012615 [Laodelphax striatellus]|uniref:Uncharacterized protein n=1 Tax=Laodelphax striatellus TaxID=195883 RepID=A0A482XNR2_LAOST|nr:hypothetical protein LSTR_LSTR012615 [Laodelphax striatellus]